jgi:hypothetical protein
LQAQKEVVQEFSSAFGEFPSKFFSNNAKLFKDQKIASKDLELEPDQYNDALSLESGSGEGSKISVASSLVKSSSPTLSNSPAFSCRVWA